MKKSCYPAHSTISEKNLFIQRSDKSYSKMDEALNT